MTIVVWDGQILATDRQANDGSQKWETDKAEKDGVDLHLVMMR